MNKVEILETLEMLACSQGSYGRYLNFLEEEGLLDEALELLEQQNFKNTFDLIMFFEG